ncbi:hypothetical protein [Shewanella sp. 125m-1]
MMKLFIRLINYSLLFSLLLALFACSKFEIGQQVWIDVQGEDPGQRGFAYGRIVSINGDLAEVKIRKAGNIPYAHELADELQANEIVFINVEKISEYESGKASYDKFVSLNKKLNSVLTKVEKSLKNNRSTKRNIELLKKYQQFAIDNGYVQYSNAIELLKQSLEIWPADSKKINKFVTWGNEAPRILNTFIAKDVAAKRVTFNNQAIGAGISVFGKPIVAAKNASIDSQYNKTVDLAMALLFVPIQGYANLVSQEEAWQYYGQFKEQVSAFMHEVGGFSQLAADKDIANDKLMEFEDYLETFEEKIDEEWLEGVRKVLFRKVAVNELVTEEEAEAAFNKLKKQVAKLEQELDMEILTLDDLDTVFLAAVDNNIERNEMVETQQLQEFEQVQQQLWSRVNLNSLFSQSAADLAYQNLLKSSELHQVEFQRKLISDEQKQALYQAVEDNQPRKKAAELKLQQQLVASASSANLLTDQDVEQAMLTLQPEIDRSNKIQGLKVDSLAIESALLAQLQTNQLADRKQNLFKNNHKWYVRLSGLLPEAERARHNLLKETELFCELTLESGGQGQLRCPLTPINSAITYDALWQVVVGYVPATARVQLEVKKLIDGPEGTPQFRHSRINPGKALVETNYQKVVGQLSRPRRFNNFIQYELSLVPFVKAAAAVELAGADKAVIKPQVLIAKSTKLGVEAFAMGDSQSWCKPGIEVELKTKDGNFYKNGQVSTFVKKLGVVIERQCASATEAKVVGKAEGSKVLYRANAKKSGQWVAIPSSS